MTIDDHPSNNQNGTCASATKVYEVLQFDVGEHPTPSLGSLPRKGCADDGPSIQVS